MDLQYKGKLHDNVMPRGFHVSLPPTERPTIACHVVVEDVLMGMYVPMYYHKLCIIISCVSARRMFRFHQEVSYHRLIGRCGLILNWVSTPLILS
jgi:hypothetical protein